MPLPAVRVRRTKRQPTVSVPRAGDCLGPPHFDMLDDNPSPVERFEKSDIADDLSICP